MSGKVRPIEWMNHEMTVVAKELEERLADGTMPPPIEGPGAHIHQREMSAQYWAKRRAAGLCD